jgi:hypothetical protein
VFSFSRRVTENELQLGGPRSLNAPTGASGPNLPPLPTVPTTIATSTQPREEGDEKETEEDTERGETTTAITMDSELEKEKEVVTDFSSISNSTAARDHHLAKNSNKKPARPKMSVDDTLLAHGQQHNQPANANIISSVTGSDSTAGNSSVINSSISNLFVLRHLSEEEFTQQFFPSPFCDPLTHPSTQRQLSASVSAVQAEKMKRMRKKSEGLVLMEEFMRLQKTYLWQLTMLLHVCSTFLFLNSSFLR